MICHAHVLNVALRRNTYREIDAVLDHLATSIIVQPLGFRIRTKGERGANKAILS